MTSESVVRLKGQPAGHWCLAMARKISILGPGVIFVPEFGDSICDSKGQGEKPEACAQATVLYWVSSKLNEATSSCVFKKLEDMGQAR